MRDKGKPSLVIIVGKLGTLHGIAGSQSVTITTPVQDHRAINKVVQKMITLMLHDRLWTIELINKKHKTGLQEWLDKVTRSRTWSCKNFGGRRIFKVPEPYSLGEDIML
jgi:hypothetical protein